MTSFSLKYVDSLKEDIRILEDQVERLERENSKLHSLLGNKLPLKRNVKNGDAKYKTVDGRSQRMV